MLPIKAGACVFVWECKKKLKKQVPIVPVGITYHNAHKFRSKVILKIGKPIYYDFDETKLDDPQYKKDKIGSMLKELEDKMKNCLIQAPSYKERKLLHYISELYVPDDIYLSSR